MDNKVTSADFNIEVKGSQPLISRNLKFENGDAISFSVKLEGNSSATLDQLHERSIEQAISNLRSLIKPAKS